MATFTDVADAHLAKAKLESEDIFVSLGDEYLVGMNWFLSSSVGGVKQFVRTEDAERAKTILGKSVEEEGESIWGNCPVCGSSSITYLRRPRGLLMFLSLMLLCTPLFLWKKKLRCSECGHQWLLED